MKWWQITALLVFIVSCSCIASLFGGGVVVQYNNRVQDEAPAMTLTPVPLRLESVGTTPPLVTAAPMVTSGPFMYVYSNAQATRDT